MFTLSPFAHGTPTVGLAGHIGVGHAHSHSGFVQDDSLGFAVLLEILRRAHPLNFTIIDADIIQDELVVRTVDGGEGRARALRGFTPFERDIVRRCIGKSGVAAQTLAIETFGRIYGQGVYEPAAALSLAAASACLDTVGKHWPAQTRFAPDTVPDCCGAFLGGSVCLNGIPVAWLLTINASTGGIGPVEDAEGTVPIGNKGLVMESIGMDNVPTLVLESKAYAPELSKRIHENTFLGRWNTEYDNPVVGECLRAVLSESRLPFLYQTDAYKRNGVLADERTRIGQRIATLGKMYAHARTAREKVALASELARIVSQDIGGSSFMSDSIFQYAGAGGLWPGHGAVLSLLAPQAHIDVMGTIVVTDEEICQIADLALATLVRMDVNKEEATAFVQARKPVTTPAELLEMIQ